MISGLNRGVLFDALYENVHYVYGAVSFTLNFNLM